MLNSAYVIPLVGTIAGTLMIVLIVAIVFWHKTRERELQTHEQLRLKEMEHQRALKQMDLEIERARAGQAEPTKARVA